MIKGYDDPRWMTYKQAADNEWQVRKGEKGTQVEFWDVKTVKDSEENERSGERGEKQNAARFIHRVYTFDGMISSMSSNYMSYLGSSVAPRPLGTAFPTVVPYRVFQAQDRSFSLQSAARSSGLSFCEGIQRSDLRSDSRFATNALRVANRVELEPILSAVFAERPAAFWLEKLHAAGIPSSLLRSFPEVVEHPQAAFRQIFPTLDHPTAGPHTVTGTPFKMSDTPGRVSKPAPLLGMDTSAALVDLLGLDAAQIEALAVRSVIYCKDRTQGSRVLAKRAAGLYMRGFCE